MSRQNAELAEENASTTDSRLDAILEQLQALGAPNSASKKSEAAPQVDDSGLPDVEAGALPHKPPMPAPAPPPRPLRSVPDLHPVAEVHSTHVEATNVSDELVDGPELSQDPPVLGLVPEQDEGPELAPPPLPTELTDAAEVAPVVAESAFDEPGEPAPLESHTVEPVPVVVEYHEAEPPAAFPSVVAFEETPPVPHEPVEIMFAPSEPQVFALDGPLATDTMETPTPPPVPLDTAFPVEPEFPTASEVSAGEFAGAPADHVADDHVANEVVADAGEDADPGWVSHHTEVVDSPADHAEGASATEFSMFAEDHTNEVDTDQVEAAFDAPQWSDVGEDPDFARLDGQHEPLTMDQLGGQPLASDEHFDSDDDLPIPDFTGVWADEEDPTVWDADAATSGIPGPIENGRTNNRISVGRSELENLRPVEEEVLSKAAPNLGRKLQLVGVVLFGLIALAVIFLDDPAAVEDLREIYDGFFG